MNEKNVIFDMDGVIFDTEQLCIDCWLKLEKKYGFTGVYDVLIKCIGTNERITEGIFTSHYGADFPYHEYRREVSGLFHGFCDEHGMPVKRGAHSLLKYLRECRCRTGLASSTKTSSVRTELEQAGLLQYFDVLVCGDMVALSKPEPDIFLKCCEEMNVLPVNTYIIEDSFNGITAAKRAGAMPVMVPDIKQPDEVIRSYCTGVFESLTEVEEYFRNIFNK